MSNQKKYDYLAQISKLFLKYGFKSVGVDDIAKELGISKKTLYQEFKDKNEIVMEVVKSFIAMEENATMCIANESINAIDEVIQMAKLISQKFEDLHPSIIFEINKYYPEAHKLFEKHKNEFVFSCIKRNLERGVKEKLYRRNLDPNIISGLFVNKMEIFMDREGFGGKKYSFPEVYFEMMRYHIRGIASEEGREYLKQRIKQLQIDL